MMKNVKIILFCIQYETCKTEVKLNDRNNKINWGVGDYERTKARRKQKFLRTKTDFFVGHKKC